MKKLAFAILLGTAGCSSFKTTAVDRLDNDMVVVNPSKPLKGVPVSLRVPSHLELCVIETSYWEKQDIPGQKPTLKPLHTCRATRTVTHNVKYTEKIFLVDPKRPAAGTEKYGFTFQSNDANKGEDAGKGYLQKVEYEVDDQTIKESANLLANSLGLINALQTSASQPNPNKSDLVSTDRTVAFGRFDINSPSYEDDVANFLDIHVNCERTKTCPQVCESANCLCQ
ncbi:MAG: hypothetical protein U0936_21465 [Planctomycetaceae bacterium]